MSVYIEREKLLHDIRYSSIYNTPCPNWVYRLIENTNFIEINQDEKEKNISLNTIATDKKARDY